MPFSDKVAQYEKQHLDPIPGYNTFILRTVLLTPVGFSIGAFLMACGTYPDDPASTFYNLFLSYFMNYKHLSGILALALPLLNNALTTHKMRPRVLNGRSVLSKDAIPLYILLYVVAIFTMYAFCKKYVEDITPLLVFTFYPPLLVANLVVILDFKVLKQRIAEEGEWYKREIETAISSKIAEELQEPNETFMETYRRLCLLRNELLGQLVKAKSNEEREDMMKQIKRGELGHLTIERRYAFFEERCKANPGVDKVEFYNNNFRNRAC